MTTTDQYERDDPHWRASVNSRISGLEQQVGTGFTRLEKSIELLSQKLADLGRVDDLSTAERQEIKYRLAQLEKQPEKNRTTFMDAIGTSNCLFQAVIAGFAGLACLIATVSVVVTIILNHH